LLWGSQAVDLEPRSVIERLDGGKPNASNARSPLKQIRLVSTLSANRVRHAPRMRRSAALESRPS
jgi:hypothetical protein